MGKNKMIDSKKLAEIREINMSNEEYVNNCFEEMLIYYSYLDEMYFKRQVAAEILKFHKNGDCQSKRLIESNKAKLKLWPALEYLLEIKQASTQKQMSKEIDEIHNNGSTKGRKLIDLKRVHLDFVERYYLYPWINSVGHSSFVISYLGGDPRSLKGFWSPQSITSHSDEIIDGEIVAGEISDGTKRAYLIAGLKDESRQIFEIDRFHMLSLSDKNYQKGFGVITIFNKNRGILYSEEIDGSPFLTNAKLSFGVLDDLGELEDDEENEIVSELASNVDALSLENQIEDDSTASPNEDIASEAPNIANTESPVPSSVSGVKKKSEGTKNLRKQTPISKDIPENDDAVSSAKINE